MCCADYFVYYPEKTSRLITGALSHVGITLSLVFVELMGAGLASGAPNIPEWASALEIGTGNLMVEAFAPLGTFGHFCAVVLALGTSKNQPQPSLLPC